MEKSAFYWSPQVALFLPALEVKTPLGMFVAVVVFAVMTAMYEGFKCLRLNVAEMAGDRWNGVRCFSKAHAVQTVLFVAEMCFAYIIMLTVMSFNGWLFLAVLIGSATGYHLCQMLSRKHKARPLTSNPLGPSEHENHDTDVASSSELLRKRKVHKQNGANDLPEKKIAVQRDTEEVEQLVTAV